MTDTEWLQYNTLIAVTRLSSIDQMCYFIDHVPPEIIGRVMSIVDQLDMLHIDIKRELDKEAVQA